MKQNLVAAVAGALFSIGLVFSGMTQQSKVQGFLNFGGDWNASLAFVMVGAIGVHALVQLLARRRKAPLLAPSFPIYPPEQLDGRLLGGAALFGVGWGLSGFCPGPALVGAFAGLHAALFFVPGMVGGMWLHALLIRMGRSDETGMQRSPPTCA
jgi:uncharacterized membrane protein YedE/YeeE